MIDSAPQDSVSLPPELSPELGSKMWVFRDGKRRVATAQLFSGLNAALAGGSSALQVLLRAGELEAALEDAGVACQEICSLTDASARALVTEQPVEAGFLAVPTGSPAELCIGTPEGFAFYLLHPLAFRDLARQVHPLGEPAAVVGIRSIGATLSAVVAATLGAERITVRPKGHPYNRTVTLTAEQQHWINRHSAYNARFYVTDEGPGFSGSSIISTCEALETAGVPIGQITVLCSAQPDPHRLMAANGAERWQRIRSFKNLPYLPLAVRDEKWYSCDHWRGRIYGKDETYWPGMWRQVEAPKFLHRDDHRLYRFIGLGHYGARVLERYQRLADAQLGPKASGEVEGFVEFWMEGGAAFTTPRWNEKVHKFMVRYLSERVRLCAAEPVEADENLEEIARMMHFNTRELTGEAYNAQLRLDFPVYADNRMQPHKFMRTPYGMRKLDGAVHGDDHFFPGACDIAWDIAGLFAEWRLSEDARAAFLRDYTEHSGDMFIRSRLRDWTIAYLAFRCGYCLMGANANKGSREGERLMSDARRYHQGLIETLSRNRRLVSKRVPA
jgi:hypothetical protein